MPDALDFVRQEVAIANRILANEGIIDAFGHISMRHPTNPNRYFISRHRASELVEPADVLEFDLDFKPVKPTGVRLYSEMVIHGEVFKARPDVNSVCHHHAMSVLPFCATGVELVPLFHLGGTLGMKVPFWDSRDEFGDTNLLDSHARGGRLDGARARVRTRWCCYVGTARRWSARACGNACSGRSTPRATRNCSCAPWRSVRRDRSAPARPRRAADTISAAAASNAPGNIGPSG